MNTKQLLEYAKLAANYMIWSGGEYEDTPNNYLARTFDWDYRSDKHIINIGEERREIFESLAYDNTNGPEDATPKESAFGKKK